MIKNILLFLLLLIIGVVSYVYLFTMAENRYEANAQFSVVIEEQTNVDAAVGLQGLLGGANLGSADTQAAIGYINSANLLLELEKEFKLPTSFSKPEKDYIFKLKDDASIEDRLKYYRKKFKAQYNSTTGLVDLSAETYSPELSYRVTLAILKKTEAFINQQNQDIASEQLKFANIELERSQKVIKEQEKALLQFQNKHKIIQPEAIIQAQLAAIQTLRLEKIHKQIELTTVRASSPNSPSIQSLATTISELENEINSQEASLSGENQQKLNNLLIEFNELTLNLEFAIQLKKGAEVLLESARAEAASNTRFFSVIQSPFIPEEETNPRRWYLLCSTLALSALAIVLIQGLLKSLFDRSK